MCDRRSMNADLTHPVPASGIKSVSWSDIPSFQVCLALFLFLKAIFDARCPSFAETLLSSLSLALQKKVTERHRELGITQRLFTDMTEITDKIDHAGHHGNRGEMGQVRSWIEERGVGSEVLGRVLNLG